MTRNEAIKELKEIIENLQEAPIYVSAQETAKHIEYVAGQVGLAYEIGKDRQDWREGALDAMEE